MFMSNFTQSGGRAKIWQSITNLSCCSIDFMTKRSTSMKALAFFMLFAFNVNSMFAQESERSTFFNRCLNDAPPGPSEADVANLYLNQCGDIPAEVVKSTFMDGNDCAWNVEYTYDIKCGEFEEQIKISYNGGDISTPVLNEGAVVPAGAQNLNVCFDNIPMGPSAASIAALYSDNCGDVVVNKSGTPSGSDCEWSVLYKYTIADTCGNMLADLDISYSGGDTEAPQLNKGASIPTGETGLNLCFSEKAQGPTVEDIAALFFDNCGTVNVTKDEQSKGTDCKWLATYTYTIQDDCLNFAESIVITYIGGDMDAPVITGVPEDITVNCIDEIPLPAKGEVFATDNCSSNVIPLATDDTSGLNGSCLGGVVVRTYTATDDCGRSVSEIQTITVLPTPESTLTTGVFPTNISCEDVAGFSAPDATYSNGVAQGACAVSGSIEADVNIDYTECGGTITVSYDGVDSCDRPLSAGPFTIIVDPAPMAAFDPIEDITITCDLANQYTADSLSYQNGASNEACLIEGEVAGELSGSYTECGGTLFVDWTYTDNCERTITAKKTITVLPAPAAQFDDVEDMTISCEEAGSFEAGSLSYTNGASNELCLIAGTVDGELSGTYTECGGTLFVNWTYSDDCGRTIETTQTITVESAPAASFDDVEDMTISCEEAGSFTAGSLSYTNGASNEACLIAGTVEGELSGTYTECGGTLFVDWTYTDNCERTITAKKAITVLPAPAAAFDDVEDMTISCDEAGSFEAGLLGYTNGASNEACVITGTVEGELSGTYTECGGTLFVDWTYTDNCERTITAKKTITVLPAPVAAFNDVEHMTVSCEEAGLIEAGSLSFTNGALNEACLISGTVEGVLSGEYSECGGLLFIDWTYTDDCGRTITAKQQIKVNPAPVATFYDVEGMTISCEEAGTFEAGVLGYTNGALNGACLIEGEVEGDLSGSYTECGGTLTVNYTYTDDCERTIEASQTITVEPATVAVFNDVEDISITCDLANQYIVTSLGYTNGASNGACEISGSVPGQLSGDYTECGGTLFVDWTYTDDCDRTITAKKTITVEPALVASFDEVQDMTISCEEAGSFTASPLSYSNGASNELCLIAGTVEGELSGDYTECGGTLFVDWTYTDECGRPINASQTITVEPAPAATFDDVDDMTISCDEAGSFEAGSLDYTNGASNEACIIEGTVLGELSGEYSECGGTLYIDWTYTDACERTITAKKTITVLAAPVAVFDEVDDMTISCDVAGFFTADSLGYTNEASNEVCEISGSVLGQLSGDYTECGGTLYVDYTFTDACERTITARKTVTVNPAPAAVFNGVMDMTISCDEAGSFEAGYLYYTNAYTSNPFGDSNGGSNEVCLIEGSVLGQLSGDYTECGGTLFVDWTYTDACDRTITAKKTITVEPAPMAEFDEVEDMTISCEDANSFEADALSYTNGASTEACLIAGIVEGEATPNYTECGGSITVNWTYTDDCGRTSNASQTITVLPAPMATFSHIMNASIPCEDLATYEPEFLSYTNGGTEACEISGSVQGEAQAFEGSCGTFEVDFTFTDDCGRTITAKQTITVIDETAPVLTGELPQGASNLDLCFDTRPEGPTEAEIAALFTDNCGNVNVTKTQSAPQEDDCSWAVMYRYEIQDDCGNFANPVKVFYNGGDQSAPLLTGTLPEGSTGLQCLSENPGAPSLDAIQEAYTDNCGTVIITPLEPVITGDDCSWTATYEYTVVDACENYAANIVIVNSGADNMAPVLEGEIPMDANSLNLCIDSDLEEPSEEDIALLYYDNCSDVTVTKIEKVYGTDCEWIRVFEYIAEDACGNKSDIIKVNYMGGDTSAPVPTGECDNETMTISTEDGAVCPQEASISLNIGDEISAGDNSWTVAGISVAQMNGSLVPCFYDNCAGIDELTFRVIDKGVDAGDCSTTLTVTFEVEDNCENVSEPFLCTFIIIDDTAPVVACPEGQDFGLVAEAPIAFADKATYTDNCQADGETQDYTDVLTSVINEDTLTTEDFTLVRTFTASDGCDNTSTCDVVYNWTVVLTPENDDCVDATPIACGDSIMGSTEYASNEGSFNCAESNFSGSPGVWYVLEGTGDILNVVADTFGSDFDTKLAVFSGVCNDLGCITGNDDASFVNTQSEVFFQSEVGVDYYLYVTGYTFFGGSPSSGEYMLSVSCEVVEPATIVDCEGPGETVEVVQYSNNELLTWTYTSSTGDPLALDFSGDTEAGYDFIYVYDGLDDAAPLLGVFSGSLSETMVTSTGDSLFIVFDSDNVVSGFSFNVNVECGNGVVIVDCEGPGETVEVVQYSNNELLTWTYTSSTGDPLALDFSGDTEAGYDFIYVYDGLDDAAPLLGVFSGSLSETMVTSTGDSLFIVFDSDNVVSGFSFNVNVECGNGVVIVDCDGPGETVEVVEYSNYEFLTWTYTSSTGDPLLLDFSGETEDDYDFIYVYDGLDDSAPLIAELSGDLSQSFVTTQGASVHVVFDSDNSVSGFSFNVNVNCGFASWRQAQVVEEDVKIDFTAYPVPFDNVVNIAYSFEFETNVTIELFDTKGLQVFSDTNKNYVTGSNGSSTFDLSRYSSQMFYVKLTTSQGTVTKKIVSSGKK